MTELNYPDAFLKFWAAYPWRSKKADALKAWHQAGLNDRDVPMILNALSWQVNQPQWLRDGGRYIPLPATWLRARSFEDEPFHAPMVTEVRETKASRAADGARNLLASLTGDPIKTLKSDW